MYQLYLTSKTSMANEGTKKNRGKNNPETVIAEANDGAFRISLPSDLESPEYQGNHYFQLTCFRSVPRKDTADQTGIKALYHIILPVPPGLTTSFSANYGTYAETGMTVAATKVVDAIAHGYQVGQGGAAGVIGAAVEGGTALKNILMRNTTAMKAEIAGVLGEGFKQSYLRGQGKAWRNVDTMAFQGMSLREWSFSWKIVPKNLRELNSLIDLKNNVTNSIHPSTAGSEFFMGYPDYFAFKIGSKGTTSSQMLPKSAPCFMTNFNLTFNGSGNPTFFEESDTDKISEPVEYDLTVSLRETRALSRESFEGKNEGGTAIDSAAKKKVGVPN